MKLLDRFFAGDRLALARIITLLENDAGRRNTLLDVLLPKTGGARRIGLTGPPGSGKSSLTDRLIRLFRQEDRTVGVIAVDPTSPFTGGALLGDRVRMQSSWDDTGVFVRSMADRTHTGGLSASTPHVITAFDAFGKDVVIVETVGVGQSTLEIADVTDTTVVVLTPESGDSIQAMKAGLMEIADILVVNKDDRAGAGHFASELRMVLNMRQWADQWQPPILRISAQNNTGVDALYEQLTAHHQYLSEQQHFETLRLRQSRTAIDRAIEERLGHLLAGIPDIAAIMDRLSEQVARREIHPSAAAAEIIKKTNLE